MPNLNSADDVTTPLSGSLRRQGKEHSRDERRSTGQTRDRNTATFPHRRSQTRGKRNANESRCTQCAASGKSCDGVKPVCGRCLRHQGSCAWPEDVVSARGSLNAARSEISGESPRRSFSGGKSMAEIQREIRGGVMPKNLSGGQDHQQSMPNVTMPPNLSVDRHMPESLPDAMRLEQIRQRVLQSTRAYLGTDPRLHQNAQEPRGEADERQV
ncbi:hypothetical protein Z517_01238 [Fonsecaea pedrosoi CBS 271.37]|uniref:Unplaced genomic scaffold supercont1.1, whole genome shotgun sequence n=1 Tax=Fonsecaea pedrosoi CBS 271.37 TaxID=1442368 RepID=A0A0D2E6V4_9EURO|nr:uncharacterized protein Z517_01238 [Fonsecaea pedrosoi CBS 271.37]KIW85846.1 hypothetical protein Z517_01238 [Fonsecaea pedrosoi CBS 271.37]